MDTEITVMTQLAHQLLSLQQQHGTGELVVTSDHPGAPQWHLYFYLGRLVYATGGSHRRRRWYRVVKQHCADLLKKQVQLKNAIPLSEPWEMHFLNLGLSRGWVTPAQAKAIIHSSLQEVMFTFVEHVTVSTEWRAGKFVAQPTVFLSVEQVLQEGRSLRQQWLEAGLGQLDECVPHFTPDLAPVVKKPVELQARVSEGVYQALRTLMNGKLTLWDVANHLQKSLLVLMRSLMPFIQQGIIQLQTVPDLPLIHQNQAKPAKVSDLTAAQVPQNQVTDGVLHLNYDASSDLNSDLDLDDDYDAEFESEDVPAVASSSGRKLIACIDDSPVIGQVMEKFLTPHGYETFSILNPLQGIATLLERKPDLIFLDLVMPNTNGYELCTFLRKTSVFQNTPIIILTGHDGVIDRVRAKLAGASEFMSKPPDPKRVMQLLNKFLGEPDVQKPAIAPPAMTRPTPPVREFKITPVLSN